MLISPPVIFSIIWSVILLLASLNVSNLIAPLKPQTIYLVSSSSLFFLVSFYVVYSVVNRNKFQLREVNVVTFRKIISRRDVVLKVRVLFFIWLFGSLLEIAFFKNLPLFSEFGFGAKLRYTEFGFPGFHGLLNSIYFFIFCYCSMRFFITKERVFLLLVLVLSLWPFLLLVRMMLMASAIQLIFIYLILRRPGVKKMLPLFLSGLFLLYMFGVLGDIRSGREMIIRIADLNFYYPELLPSFPVWFYVYVVSPINNINFTIPGNEINVFPIYTLSFFIPSPVRNVVFGSGEGFNNIELVVDVLNVTSIYGALVSDFGYLLSPFFFILLGLLSAIVVSKAKEKPDFFIAWVVLLYAVVVSIFSNHMLHLVFLFEFLISFFVFRKFRLFGSSSSQVSG